MWVSDENGVIHCDCKAKYKGPKCALCADGLYASDKSASGCMECQCNSNSYPSTLVICDGKTGTLYSAYFLTHV